MNRERMRRSHAGNYYDPLPTQYDGDALEESNEQMTSELRDKVSALKTLTIEIGNEVKYQDKVLRSMDNDFERTGGFLGNTMNRVMRLGKGNHNYYICYLFLFSIVVFFILYVVIKLR